MPTYSTTPTATQILRRCRHLSSVNQNQQATARFAGTAVCWRVRFFSAQEAGTFGSLQFSFTQRGMHLPGPMGDGLIYAGVSTSEFPELQNLRRAQRLVLYGQVIEVDELLGVTIILDRAEVTPFSALDRIINFFNGNTG